jgi:hypothetical protein
VLGPVSTVMRMPPELFSTKLQHDGGVSGSEKVDAFAAINFQLETWVVCFIGSTEELGAPWFDQ